MKSVSRWQSRNRRHLIDRALKLDLESLESRVLLSAGTSPVKHLAPVRNVKVDVAEKTFRANTGPTRTVTAAPASRGGPEVQINVGPVVNISRATGNHTEADIAINPTNTDQIFAVSNIASGSGLFSSRSNDGGATWTTAVIATGSSSDGLPAACCDARVEYDTFGNLFMVYLSSSAGSQFVARSTNNGQTWQVVDTKTGGWDNPDFAIGANNQLWVQARGPGGAVGYGALSTGLGAPITFSAAQVVPTTGSTGSFGDVAVCNDGSILISYITPSGGQGPGNVPIWRDPDGLGPQGFLGLNGSTTQPILNTPTNVGGFDFIPMQNGRSVDPECSFVVIPPGMPFAGRVLFMYANETVNENHDHDIVVRYSDDNGLTWSNEVRVNDDPASPIRSQMLGQIAVDRTTGAVVVSFHDGRNDNGVAPNGTNAVANDDAQFFGALTTDGGITWTNFPIDLGWSNAVRANNGIDFGDWTGSDYHDGRFFAVWASNAQGVNGLPNNPSPNQFDLATARVDIIGAGIPGVYGLVFDDVNGNGARDGGEGGLTGVTIYIDANNNSTFDPGEENVTTASGGSYGFTTLTAGTYVLRAVAPAGQRPVFPAGGSYTVTFDGTTTITGRDFGFVNPRVAGTVFNDANDNGVFDTAESGQGGVTLYIDANGNSQLDPGETNVTSGANGAYSLGGLADGSYVVRAVTPAGRRLTFPAGGSYSATVGGSTLVFDGRNFGLTDRVRLGGVVYNDANGNGQRDPGETGITGARVYQDLNNNGLFDNTGGTFNAVAPNVPLPVPPSGTIGITTSNLEVSGVGNVSNLTLRIGNLTHTFDGDLILTLISPAGTRVTLSNRRGGSGDNFINTVFDDAAAQSITTGAAPFTGSFRPEQALSTLNGQNGNGTWKLEINDAASGDSGVLNSWSITMGSTEPNAITPGSGAYTFAGLSAGTYNLRQVAIPGQTLTEPASGVWTFNAIGGQLVDDADFGNSSAAPAPAVTSSTFAFDGPGSTLPNAPHRLSFAFNVAVGNSIDAGDLQLLNTTTNQTVPTANVAVSYNSGTNTATYTFPGYPSGILPDGNYTATLLAAGIQADGGGTPMASNYVTNYFVLAGDANHDGRVNLDDFNVLAGNFGQSNRIFSQGDFNYSGNVNLDDFNILASRFGTTLSGPSGAPGELPAPPTTVARRGGSGTSLDSRGNPFAGGRRRVGELTLPGQDQGQVVLLDEETGRLVLA